MKPTATDIAIEIVNTDLIPMIRTVEDSRVRECLFLLAIAKLALSAFEDSGDNALMGLYRVATMRAAKLGVSA